MAEVNFGLDMSKAAEPRSYVLETPNGKTIRRNRVHIRDAPAKRVHFDDTEVQKPHAGIQTDQAEEQVHQPAQQPSADKPTDLSTSTYITRSGRSVKTPQKYEPE